jgi:putative methionine-R-sulfoxide reductase with GAF domain
VNTYATLGAVERILVRGGDADDVLRDVVAALHEHLPSSWVGISFVEADGLVPGPAVGELRGEPVRCSIRYDERPVAELAISSAEVSEEDRALLERVADMLGPYCLVGWDTGGEAWSP